MDSSITIEPTQNQISVSLIKVETIYEFVSTAQVVEEKKEVE